MVVSDNDLEKEKEKSKVLWLNSSCVRLTLPAVANYSFDSNVLPVPQAQQVSFCQDLDTSVLDSLGQALKRLTLFGVLILAIVAVVLVLFNVIREWWSWKCLNRTLENTQRVWRSQNPSELRSSPLVSKLALFRLLETARHPLTTDLAHRGLAKLGVSSPSARDRTQWWLSFITHPMALVVLCLGVIGTLSIEAQLLALSLVQNHFEQVRR